jgi:hypothetical protein
VPPTPVRLTRRALEGGPTTPSNAFSVITQGHAVTSGQWDRSSPSLSTLCDHPRHCRTMPDIVTTSRHCWGARGQDITTTATVPRTDPPLAAPSNRPTDGGQKTNHYAATLETAPVRAQDAPQRLDWRRIRQDGRQLRGTAHQRKRIVRHACKLLPPWPIKGGAVPQPQGTRDDGQQSLTRSLPSP